jgi:hypothetical protein
MVSRYTKYILLHLAFAVLIIPIRLLGIFNTAYVVIPIGLVISFVIALNYYVSSRGKGLGWIEIIILTYPLLTIPLAFINGHPINYIITDTLKPILWIGVLGFFKNVSLDEKIYIKSISNVINFFALCSLITVVLVLSLIIFGVGVRASASDVTMLFPLFYFYVKGNVVGLFILLIVLLLGGKVGPLFSVVLVFFLLIFIRISVKNIFLIVGATIISLVIMLNFDYEIWRGFFPFLSKFDLVFAGNISSEDFDTLDNAFFGGRLAEVFSSIVIYVEKPLLLITGPGVGYTYDLYRSGSLYDMNHHGVHFSPVSLLTIYGGFYTLVFYAYFSLLFFRALKIFRKHDSGIKKLAAMFFIASFFNSFTVFSIFSILLFPMCIGLLLNRNIYNFWGGGRDIHSRA